MQKRLIGLLILVFCVAIMTDVFPTLRGEAFFIPKNGRWVWGYGHPRWLWLIPCTIGFAVYLAGAWSLLHHTQADHYPRRLILWTFVAAVLLPLLLLSLEGRPLFLLFARSVSQLTGGTAYALTMADHLRGPLRDWPQFVSDYRAATQASSGIALSPPGLLALNYAPRELFEAAPPLADRFGGLLRPLQCQNLQMMTWTNADLANTWFQLLNPLWAALAAAPLYRLGTRLFDARTARWAVVLWPLIPGMAIFVPRYNIFYPLLALVMLLQLWRGLEQNSWRRVLLAGFIVSGGIFFNLSLMPLGLLAGLIILGCRLILYRGWLIQAARDLTIFGLGSVSIWLIFWILSGQSPYTIISTGMKYHTALDRPYFPWLLMHPYDMAVFVGLPVIFLALRRIRQVSAYRAAPRTSDVWAGALLLTVVIIVFSGTARGETGRVWLFFSPLWVLLAADMLARQERRDQMMFVGLQALCLLTLAAFLRANFTTLTDPPRPAEAAQPPTFSVNARLEQGADRVTLVGLSVESTSEAVTLHLHWRAETWVEHPYVLSVLPVPPDGSTRDSVNWNPEGWNYPPSCWTPGRTFVDTVVIPLGENAPPGAWLFSLSIFDAFTRQPMHVTEASGQTSFQVGIGPVQAP
jgi:hypothetical protein